MTGNKQHITLRQFDTVGKEKIYEVIETRNTIRFKIGQQLTEKEVRDDLGRIDYTVKPQSVRG